MIVSAALILESSSVTVEQRFCLFSESEKTEVTRATFSRSWHQLCISSNSDWFIGLVRFVLIGHVVTLDYVRIFYKVQWNPVNTVTNGFFFT